MSHDEEANARGCLCCWPNCTPHDHHVLKTAFINECQHRLTRFFRHKPCSFFTFNTISDLFFKRLEEFDLAEVVQRMHVILWIDGTFAVFLFADPLHLWRCFCKHCIFLDEKE